MLWPPQALPVQGWQVYLHSERERARLLHHLQTELAGRGEDSPQVLVILHADAVGI